MGQNIGTCVTAMLSAIGAKKNAKRAATIHLMFNMIGTVLFLTVFYTLNLFMHFAFLGENAAPVGIAMIHTIFNVTVTLVLLPFNQMLVKLAYVVIPVTDDEKSKNSGKLTILDERFLEVPGYALEISETAALTMFQEVRRSLGMSETLIKNYQPDTVVEMKDSEELVDGYENQISNYLLALSHKGINEAESQKLSVLLYTVNDIETISDQVCNIGIAYRGLDAKENAFSEMALNELSVLQEQMCIRDRFYGNVALIDGMLDKIEEEMGQKLTIIATGGLAKALIPYCKHDIILDDALLLKGLKIIYEKNK